MPYSAPKSKPSKDKKRARDDSDSEGNRHVDKDVALTLDKSRKKKKRAPPPAPQGDDAITDSEAESTDDENARLRAENAHLRAECEKRANGAHSEPTPAPRASGSGSTTAGAKRIPLPDKKTKIKANKWRKWLGWTATKGPWLQCRAYTRRAVDRAPLDLWKPWKKQDPGDVSAAVALLTKRVPDLNRFEKNWGALQLIQETFNHMRETFMMNELSSSDDDDDEELKERKKKKKKKLEKREKRAKAKGRSVSNGDGDGDDSDPGNNGAGGGARNNDGASAGGSDGDTNGGADGAADGGADHDDGAEKTTHATKQRQNAGEHSRVHGNDGASAEGADGNTDGGADEGADGGANDDDGAEKTARAAEKHQSAGEQGPPSSKSSQARPNSPTENGAAGSRAPGTPRQDASTPLHRSPVTCPRPSANGTASFEAPRDPPPPAPSSRHSNGDTAADSADAPNDPLPEGAVRSSTAAAALAAINRGVPVPDKCREQSSKKRGAAGVAQGNSLPPTSSLKANSATAQKRKRASEGDGNEDIAPKPKSPRLPAREQLPRRSKAKTAQEKELAATTAPKGKKRKKEGDDGAGGAKKHGRRGNSPQE